MVSDIMSREVGALVQDEAGFYDIYGMVHCPWWQHPGLKLFLSMLILLVLVFFITRFIKRKKEKKLMPWDKALRDIDMIKQRTLAALAAPVVNSEISDREIGSGSSLQAGQTKASLATQEAGSMFYVELSKIVKSYLYERYGFDVLGKTDQELIGWAERELALAEVHEALTTILNGGEYTKFAGCQAASEAIEHHALMAQDSIRRTIPTKNSHSRS